MVVGGKVKHRQVYEYIHRKIVGGKFAGGQRIPTEAELARQFNASRVTVARALRELEQQGLLVRRRGAGTFVSETTAQHRQLLAMISADSAGTFTTMTDVIVRLAQQNGLGVLLGRQVTGEAEAVIREIESLCDEYTDRKVAGVFFIPMDLPPGAADLNARSLQMLTDRGIPVVLLDHDFVPFPGRSAFDLVGVDHVNAGFQLTEHLLRLGRGRIAFVRDLYGMPHVSARIAGYREALLAAGAELDSRCIAAGDTADAAFVRRLLADARPDAVICVNDHQAAQLMRTLVGMELKVPDDIAVVGMNNDRWATFLTVSLTTIRQPWADLAAAAVKMMIERLARPSLPPTEVCLRCELLVRESSGAGPTLPAGEQARKGLHSAGQG